MTCFSFGSGLWLSKIWEARLPSYPRYLQIHQKEAIRSRVEKERRIKKGLGKEWITFEWSERSPEELTNFFSKNFMKPPDWRLNKGVVSGTLQAVLTLYRQRWGWCYKPHRSKVKGANKANLFRIKVRTGISHECDIVATPDQQPKSRTLLGMSKGLAWGSCWRSLSTISNRQLDSIIKENLCTLLTFMFH